MLEKEIKEVKKIRVKYEHMELDKLDELKRLDKTVRKPAIVFAYIFGIIGSLVLGTGMCLAMKIIGSSMVLGIVIGLVGICMVSVNYSIYKKILNNRKAKYSKEIIELSDCILAK